MKNIIYSIITILITIASGSAQNILTISSEDSTAGFLQEDPRLYFGPNNSIIIAWKDYRYGVSSYFAQKVDNDLNPVGDNFAIASNISVVQNEANITFCTTDINYPDDLLGGGCFVTYGSLYNNYEPVKINFPFFGACYGWCGTGFTGEDRVTLPMPDGFLFMGRYDQNIEFVRILNSGDTTNTRHGLYNNYNENRIVSIDMVPFNDSLNVIAWFELTDNDSLKGPFYGFLNSRDSLTVKYNLNNAINFEFPYYSFIEAGLFKIKVLPDNRIMLYTSDYESKKLYTYNISAPGQNVTVDSITINTTDVYPNFESMNITNTQDSHYYIIIRESQYPDYVYFGYKFDDSGQFTGTQFKENKADVIREDIKYTGNDKLLISAKVDDDIYLYNTTLLQKTDSIKINTDLPNSNDHNSRIFSSDKNTFFVTWQSAQNYFGRKITNDGVVDENVYSLSGTECRLSRNAVINFWSYGIRFMDKDFNIIKSDTLGTTDFWHNVTAEIFKDSVVIVAHADLEKIDLRKYDLTGNLLQEKRYLKELNQYYSLQIFLNDDGTFWLNSGNIFIQKYDINLDTISDFTYFEAPPLLKFNENYFFVYLTYYGENSQYKIGYLLNPQNDTLSAYNDVPPQGVEFKAHKINDKSFILTWAKDNKIMARVYHTDGSTEPEFIIYQAGESVSCVDAAFGRNGDETLFTWSDNNVKEKGYSVRGRILKTNTITSVANIKGNQPEKFRLNQAYPNPFNPSTKISYTLGETGYVILKIYNILGQEIETLINGVQNKGNHSIEFNAKDLSSGLYFYRLNVTRSNHPGKQFTDTKKMLLVR